MIDLILSIALFLAAVGVFVLLWGRRKRTEAGIPAGEVFYSDTDDWHPPEKPLISRRHGLVGRPDYLMRTNKDGVPLTIPVEVKSRKRPSTPYAGHILQLMTYCLLVEDNFDVRPPYGLLRYADATLRIDYTDDLRQQVLDIAAAIRTARQAPHIPRQHGDENRCRACGYRAACGDEALI